MPVKGQTDDTSSFTGLERSISVPTFRDDLKDGGARLERVVLDKWMTTDAKTVRVLMSGQGLSDYTAKPGSEHWYHIDDAFGWYYVRVLFNDQPIIGNAAGLLLDLEKSASVTLIFEFYVARGAREDRSIPPRHRNRFCIATISDNEDFATSILQLSMDIGPVAPVDLSNLVLEKDAPKTCWTIPASRTISITHSVEGIVIVTHPEPDELAKNAEDLEPQKAPLPAKQPANSKSKQPKTPNSEDNGEERLQPKDVIAILSGRDSSGKAVVRVTWKGPAQTLTKEAAGPSLKADVVDAVGKSVYRKMVNRADNIMVEGVPFVDGISKVRLMITETDADGNKAQGWSETLIPIPK